MPTSATAQALVAAALSGADPADPAAVARFYRHGFPRYPAQARALIADFLIGSATIPPAGALARLKDAISAFPAPPARARTAARVGLVRLSARTPRRHDVTLPGRV